MNDILCFYNHASLKSLSVEMFVSTRSITVLHKTKTIYFQGKVNGKESSSISKWSNSWI